MQLKNFIKIYEKSFIENWELPALTDYPTGRTLNYSDVAREIALSHVLFESLGIHRGSKIALCGKDTSAWVVAYPFGV